LPDSAASLSSSAVRVFAVDAVAFDLDGTLLDTIHDLAAAVNAWLAEQALPPLPKATIRDLVGKGIEHLLGAALALVGTPVRDADTFKRQVARYQAIYGDLLGRESVLFPGVREGLATLRAQGFRLAVVTNKVTRFVAPHLEMAGIAADFDVIVGGDDAVRKKPDAAPLELCAARLGIATQRLLMVGDSGNDVASARAAGCPVLVVPYGYREGLPVQKLGADGIVDSFVALAQRVRRSGNTSPPP
jgi:phosphoglycolate phosphatase